MRVAKENGVLILSHRGKSFVRESIRAVRALGLEAYVLSSRPADPTVAVIEELQAQCDRLAITKGSEIESADVQEFLGMLEREGKEVAACLSVWDGYRALMASANRNLGTNDIGPETLSLVLDKFVFRNLLAKHGLTRARAEMLSESSLPRIQESASQSGAKKFVKPRRGLASFAAFSLSPELCWADLEKLRVSAAADIDYRGIFRDSEFIVEDIVPGKEHSFEILAMDGEIFVAGVHEKMDLVEAGKTTLESACVSPPATISKAAVEAGIIYLQKVFRLFGLTTGCYHVEARYDETDNSWDMIEINPRMGGAFIHSSVKLNTGLCLIDAWLRALLSQRGDKKFRSWIQQSLSEQSDAATFFRVFFGDPGKRIESISWNVDGDIAPELTKLFVQPGVLLPDSEREVFLGQALWRLDNKKMREVLPRIILESRAALRVGYQ